MRSGWISVIVSAVCLATLPEAGAQNITLQQPAFGRFSVGTTVVAPDRGASFLGRVARAGESLSAFGPFRSGTSTGLFREHSGLSAHVWIHDLREMDRRILQQRHAPTDRSDGRRLSGYAAHAYSRLRQRPTQGHSSRSEANGLTSGKRTSEDPAAMYYRLGQLAEREGRYAKAALLYRLAARYGSPTAQRRRSSFDAARTAQIPR